MCSAIAEPPSTAQQLARVCAEAPVRPHHAGLLAAVQRVCPDLAFRQALTRGGWYRLGGVIGATGARLSAHLQGWAEQAWQACGEDPYRFADAFGGQGLLATRIAGRTHYFVSPYGRRAGEFFQLEVEELQEVADRRLFDPDEPPADLQELVDPAHRLRVDPQPVARPRYALRRYTDIQAFVERIRAQSPAKAAVVRFIEEWEASSAGAAAHFSDEWVLALGEHLDRYKQPHPSAKPVPAPRKRAGPLEARDSRGAELAAALHIYDRHAGYPLAWYFRMVSNDGVAREVAARVAQDLACGFDYLPRRDAAILAQWVEAPYCV